MCPLTPIPTPLTPLNIDRQGGEKYAPNDLDETTLSIDALPLLVEAAFKAHREDAFVEAERLYRQALRVDPNHADCLHWLGIIRMQRFDHSEALDCLWRAGELTDWAIPSYRQNYANCLTILLSARVPENTDHRFEMMRAQRASVRVARTSEPTFTYCVAVIAAGAPLHAVAATLRSLAALGQHATEAVLFGVTVKVANNGPFLLRTAPWPAEATEAAAALSDALMSMTARYTIIVHAGDVIPPDLINALADLNESGAYWGVARCAPEARPEYASVATALERSFAEFERMPRVAASLLRDPNLIAMACNVLWDREFLLSRLAECPQNFHALCELSMWQNEPICIARSVAQFGRRLRASGVFWNQTPAPIDIKSDDYFSRALSGRAAPNPLAPSVEANGLAFLKPLLRAHVGQRLSPSAVRIIAQRVLGETPSQFDLSTDGIELVGFARAETGLGESIRLLAHSCHAGDLPLAITNIPQGWGSRDHNRSMDQWIVDRPVYDIRLLCMNPNEAVDGYLADGPVVVSKSYNVGYWWWELENLPSLWSDCARLVDEVWVATEFVALAARKSIDKPIVKIMLPIDARQPLRRYARAEFGLPDAAFTFMFSFDFWSYPARKNPEAVVRAFKLAFDDASRDVRLVIKCHGTHPTGHSALLTAIDGDERITLLNQTLSRDALIGLQSVIDCFVSLHRSEGLGLGLAECMALGKPVIGTAYSGNLEFMHEGNSLLVDYGLVDVREGQYPDWRGQRWAEPSVVHAAQHMRRLYEDRAFASALGLAGQKTVLTEYSRERVGNRIRAEFNRIRNARGNRHLLAR